MGTALGEDETTLESVSNDARHPEGIKALRWDELLDLNAAQKIGTPCP